MEVIKDTPAVAKLSKEKPESSSSASSKTENPQEETKIKRTSGRAINPPGWSQDYV